MKLVLSITLGIVLATTILYLVEVAVIVHFFNQTVEYFQSENDKQLQRVEDKRLATLRAETLKRTQLVENKRLSKLKQLEYKRKETAWGEYYQDPENCLSYESEKHMVECINLKMRARKVFDKLYASNSLPSTVE